MDQGRVRDQSLCEFLSLPTQRPYPGGDVEVVFVHPAVSARLLAVICAVSLFQASARRDIKKG